MDKANKQEKNKKFILLTRNYKTIYTKQYINDRKATISVNCLVLH